MVRERVVAAMEGGVEAGDLRQLGEARENASGSARGCSAGAAARAARKRSSRASTSSSISTGRSYSGPPCTTRCPTAIGSSFCVFAQPGAGGLQRGRHVGNVARGDRSRSIRLCSSGALGAQPRPRADAVHLALDQARELAARVDREHLKLDAR